MNAPQQPSPAQQTAQQTQINNAAAAANQAYSMPNQVGPYGTQTSVQTGTRTIPAVTKVNKKGKTVTLVPAQEIPVYTQTTQLSPEQQNLLNQQQQFGSATNALGLAQIGRLEESLSKPVDLSNENVSGYITDLYRKRLDPIWNDRQQSLETELRNQGLQPGTKGWDAAMANFDYGRNDAYDQVLRSARAQSVQEMLAERNQRVNETGALMSGGQVTLPQFANLGGPTVGAVDYAALNANNYAQKTAQYNAMTGGLFDLGAAGIKAVGPAALGGGSGGWSMGTP
jgi:hypothetical protein